MFQLSYFPRKLFASTLAVCATAFIVSICPCNSKAQTSVQRPKVSASVASKVLNKDFRPLPTALQVDSSTTFFAREVPARAPARTFGESDASY